MPVSYLVCAAGRGTRTKSISETIPKPLLKMNGLTLLQLSVESLPLQKNDQLIILHTSSITSQQLEPCLQAIQNKGIQIDFVAVSEFTRGQLATAALALDILPAQNTVCIYNADTAFECRKLLSVIESSRWDGLVPCSIEPGNSWSFCEVATIEDNGVWSVIRVAEKERISNWCSVGFYWFKSQLCLKNLIQTEMQMSPEDKELYVAPIYNRMLENGMRVGMVPVEKFQAMGTVDQIETYWGLSLNEMRAQNK